MRDRARVVMVGVVALGILAAACAASSKPPMVPDAPDPAVDAGPPPPATTAAPAPAKK
jgi:hypothetical protein